MRSVTHAVAAVAVAGALVTTAGSYAVREVPGVFVATARVTIVPPPDRFTSNRYTSPTGSAIAIAGVVAMMVDPVKRPKLASPDSTLVGSGVRRGVWVKLPDSGGQWASAFTDPWLDVEVVDTDQARAQSIMGQKIDEIQSTLALLQEQEQVRPKYRFTTELVPASGPQIDYVRGRANAATAMTLALGGGLTLGLCTFIARVRRRRSRPPVAA